MRGTWLTPLVSALAAAGVLAATLLIVALVASNL